MLQKVKIMKYVFEININTDGDFCLPFIPTGMKFDGNEKYTFSKTYESKLSAITDIMEICSFLKTHIHTSRDYVKKAWCECIDRFTNSLHESEQYDGVYQYMSGNYDGTDFYFHPKPAHFKCDFYLTDEEYEIVKNSHINVTDTMLKEAVLNLYNSNKDKNIAEGEDTIKI